MLVSNIVRQLESHHILNNFQHCFRQLNSCETQLIGFINDFAKDVQNGGQTLCDRHGPVSYTHLTLPTIYSV